MNLIASREADAITSRLIDVLLTVPLRAGEAADFRRAAELVRSYAVSRIIGGTFATDVLTCFDLALQAGGTMERFDRVRQAAQKESPVWLSGQAIASLFLRLALIHAAKAMALLEFRSRQAVEATLERMNVAFGSAEGYAADRKESAVYRALVVLHSAVTRDLLSRSRPLPRIVEYKFGRPLPSLRLSQRLYATAGREEDLRLENKTPHPLFMPISGRAFSA